MTRFRIKFCLFWKGILPLFFLVPSEAYSQSDCRLDLTSILPVVDPQVAEVMDYEWDPRQRMEIMLIDSLRMAIITQDGCMRHYTRFQLELFRPLPNPTQEDWIGLLKSFIFPLFNKEDKYEDLWTPFLESFEQNLYVHGTNQQFDVSLGSQDFLCFVQDLPNRNPAIFIEQIGFLFKEQIRKGTSSKKLP